MKYVIKVENLQNLPETRPLIAMDANGNIQIERKIPEPVPPVGPPNNEIWYTTTNGEPIDLSGGGSGSGSGADWPEYEILPYEGGKGIIKFAEDLTEIPSNGFKNIENLETIMLPNGIERIGEGSFIECINLTSVTIPNSITDIGLGAFWYCISLAAVTIPDSVISIEDAAFHSSGLTSIIIPDSVTNVKTQTFESCSSLTSVTIPNSVTTIGVYAFSGCTSLTSISYTGTVSQWNVITKKEGWHNQVPISTKVCCLGETPPAYIDL